MWLVLHTSSLRTRSITRTCLWLPTTRVLASCCPATRPARCTCWTPPTPRRSASWTSTPPALAPPPTTSCPSRRAATSSLLLTTSWTRAPSARCTPVQQAGVCARGGERQVQAGHRLLHRLLPDPRPPPRHRHLPPVHRRGEALSDMGTGVRGTPRAWTQLMLASWPP